MQEWIDLLLNASVSQVSYYVLICGVRLIGMYISHIYVSENK